ncbi:MAG: BatA domain-containing protein [Armatimonadetes bacterium]|nr:BatA domain-containing protein [Armatimonadota bacterium]
MAWAHPLALWLLVAAPLPVLFHLLGRARPRVLVFPGAFLLRQIETRQRSIRLRHALVLLLRVLAICLAAVLTAGPRTWQPLPFLPRAADFGVFVDASASMAAGERPPLERARRALERIRALAPELPVDVCPAPADRQDVAGTPFQGSVADAVLANGYGTALVLTDMDASSVLPRRWPPGGWTGQAILLDCGPPAPGEAMSAWVRPLSPPPAEPAIAIARSRNAAQLVLRADGKPAGLLRGRCSLHATLVLATPGAHRLEVGDRFPFDLALMSPPAWPVCIRSLPATEKYLCAAADPEGHGQPMQVQQVLDHALVLIATADVEPPERLGEAGLVLFWPAGAEAVAWRQFFRHLELSDVWLSPAAPMGMSAGQQAGIVLTSDAPPRVAAALRPIAEALATAGIARPARLQTREWQVAARFTNGWPAILWSTGKVSVIVLAFSPRPEDAHLVQSGAFAALVHACIAAVAPAAGPVPWRPATESQELGTKRQAVPSRAAPPVNPPPAELAGLRARPEDISRAWGGTIKVATPENAERHVSLTADLAPVAALALLLAAAAEWLVAASVSAVQKAEKLGG